MSEVIGRDNTEWILKNINFEAKPGDIIALVGPTGHGKTTIINLLSRFYDPQEGKIYIDGNNLADINMYSLRSQMGIVPQDSFLFSGTVIENLKYGNHDVSDDKVFQAAKELGLHQFIEKLNNGYLTQVKERGVGLSEGERQLICITRVFIADPKILIFDEATSAVDTTTELIIQEAMEKLLHKRSCFVIAQRLSTIRKASLILVIHKGEIIERGTHTELLNLSGFYSNMHKEFISLK